MFLFMVQRFWCNCRICNSICGSKPLEKTTYPLFSSATFYMSGAVWKSTILWGILADLTNQLEITFRVQLWMTIGSNHPTPERGHHDGHWSLTNLNPAETSIFEEESRLSCQPRSQNAKQMLLCRGWVEDCRVLQRPTRPSDQVSGTDRPSLQQVAPTPPPAPPPPPWGQRPQKETPDLVVCLQQSQCCCTALQQPARTAAAPPPLCIKARHCAFSPTGRQRALVFCSLCTASQSVWVHRARVPTACVYWYFFRPLCPSPSGYYNCTCSISLEHTQQSSPFLSNAPCASFKIGILLKD